MSRQKRTQRHDNGKVKLFYIPLDMATLETALPALTNSEVGELIRALFDYEKSGGEELKQISGNGKIIIGACVKNLEAAREKIDATSKKNKENIDKRYGRTPTELEPLE